MCRTHSICLNLIVQNANQFQYRTIFNKNDLLSIVHLLMEVINFIRKRQRKVERERKKRERESASVKNEKCVKIKVNMC